MGTDKRERQKAARQARLEAARAQEAAAERRRRAVFIGALVGLVAVVIGISVLASNRDEDVDAGADGTSTTIESPLVQPGEFAYGSGECPPVDGAPEPVLEFPDAPQLCIDPTKQYLATFDTTEGQVQVLLDTERTPGTANNFVSLARYGYYDGTDIFRADPSIEIIQGGAPQTNDPSDPGPGYTIPDEDTGFTYVPGQLVMARTPQPDSAGAQFFFTAGPAAAALDQAGTYVVFGQVVEGLDVVQAILGLSDGSGQFGGSPSRQVTVTSVTIEELPAGSITTTTTPPAPAELVPDPAAGVTP